MTKEGDGEDEEEDEGRWEDQVPGRGEEAADRVGATAAPRPTRDQVGEGQDEGLPDLVGVRVARGSRVCSVASHSHVSARGDECREVSQDQVGDAQKEAETGSPDSETVQPVQFLGHTQAGFGVDHVELDSADVEQVVVRDEGGEGGQVGQDAGEGMAHPQSHLAEAYDRDTESGVEEVGRQELREADPEVEGEEVLLELDLQREVVDGLGHQGGQGEEVQEEEENHTGNLESGGGGRHEWMAPCAAVTGVEAGGVWVPTAVGCR